jgi:hypothetical protein
MLYVRWPLDPAPNLDPGAIRAPLRSPHCKLALPRPINAKHAFINCLQFSSGRHGR